MRTHAQKKLLAANKHFHILDELSDGDLLIISQLNRPSGELIRTHAEERAYILDRRGNVQGLDYHYRYYHAHNIHAFRAKDSPPSTDGPAHLHKSR